MPPHMKLLLATGRGVAAISATDGARRIDTTLEGRNASSLAVDPLRPELLYCGTWDAGAWRSADGGRSWQPVGPGITYPMVVSLAVSRCERVAGRGVVFAGTEPSALFRSEDGGASWRESERLTELPSANEWSFPPRPHTHHVRWIQPDPHVSGRLFVAIEAGALVRSLDGGATWRDRVPHGPRDSHQLASHPSAPGRSYSAAGDGYFESGDGGESWRQLEEGLRHRYLWSVAVDAGNAENRLVSAAASARHSHDRGVAESFIYRRSGESSWVEVRAGLPEPNGRRTAILASHPSEPGAFFAAWEDDVFRSGDGGSSWERLDLQWPSGFRPDRPRAMSTVESD